MLAVPALGAAILFSGTHTNVFAANNDNQKAKTIESHQEITDLNKLYERAQKGISDLSFSSEKSLSTKSSLSLKEKSNNNELNFHKYQTAQLLTVKQEADGTKIKTYAVTTMEVAPTQTVKTNTIAPKNNLIRMSVDASKSDSKWDSTIGVKAYSTVYYDNKTDPRGSKHWDMSKVKGGWKVTDNRYSLSGMKVTYGQNGWSYWKGGVVTGQVSTKYPKGTTFSYTVPSSWKPVVANGSFSVEGSAVGCTSYVKIKKSGSKSWSLSFTNNLGS